MIGTTLSHYQIEAELGRGGMGVVYRAQDKRLQRQVALKLLAGRMAPSLGSAASAVLAEARAASALNHPSIVTIYEVGEHNGEHFIVMELLSGSNLRSLINAKSVELSTVFRTGVEIAEALHAAHSEGVIHGDIKPENVMVLANGHVKLLDFGIARNFGGTTRTLRPQSGEASDRDGDFAGTLAYIAPEALRSSHIDSRGDLYSLGVLLYELATGSRPFAALSPTALIEQILHQPAPDLIFSMHGRSAGLGEIVKRLLAKDPEARYQSAHEVQVELAVAERDFEIGPIISSAQANKRILAVLPFRLLTPDPASEFLSVALADALINQLGSHHEIIVRPTNSILRYVSRVMDPLLAARELNTNICVEGSIQKVGSRIRVHVQVWDTSDRRSLASAKHEADDTELFELQDSMASNVASVLGLTVFKPTLAQPPPTNNPIAYELFLRAVACLSRYSRWEVRSAITMLEEATRLDVQFADAWAQLADACMRMFTLFEPGEHWLRQAEHAVRRCLAVDPGNADGYCVRARIQWSPPQFRIRNALRSTAKALRLNPVCRQAQVWQGMYLFHAGLHEEANHAITAALAVNPEDPLAIFGLGHVALYSWDYETAYKYHSRALAIDPSHFYAALMFPGVPLYAGDLNDAEDKIKFARRITPENPLVSSWEALLFAKRGDSKRAEAALRSATRSKQLFTYSHHVAHTAAAAFAILGKADSAVTWLRRASETGFPDYLVLRDDPHLANLRDVPEFRRLLSGLKRQWAAFHQEFSPSG